MNMAIVATKILVVHIIFFSIVSFGLSLNPRPNPPFMFIFGDSLFDPGNNNYINTTTLDQANFWPYGESYFKHPTGRFSDGRLISDFIGEHAKLPLIPPYLEGRNDGSNSNKLLRGVNNNYHGVNFASAGAGVLIETFQGSVIDLKTQLKYYKREVGGGHITRKLRHPNPNLKPNVVLSNAVHMFSIGTNDYISPFLLNSTLLQSHSPSEYVHMVIANLTLVLKEIYKTGGRKFVFLNLGNLGCLPGLRIISPQNKCLLQASLLAQLHNNQLNKLLSKLEQNLQGFKYFLYDYNQSLTNRITQPSLYGFKQGNKACCGSGRFNGIYSCGGKRLVKDFELCKDPSKFIFWDSYHLTEQVYKQMADQMWTSGPNTLEKLFR